MGFEAISRGAYVPGMAETIMYGIHNHPWVMGVPAIGAALIIGAIIIFVRRAKE